MPNSSIERHVPARRVMPLMSNVRWCADLACFTFVSKIADYKYLRQVRRNFPVSQSARVARVHCHFHRCALQSGNFFSLDCWCVMFHRLSTSLTHHFSGSPVAPAELTR